MVVVIDRPFFDAMDQMPTVDHISNCDIVWMVVDYNEEEPGKARLYVSNVALTTLEDAIKGLTAGEPTTLPEFEAKLTQKAGGAFDRTSR